MPGIDKRPQWHPTNNLDVHPCYYKNHPEMSFRWLSENTIRRKGMRQWAFVPKDNENDPEPSPDNRVRRGTLVLGMMPKYMVAQREEYMRKEANSKLATVEEGVVLEAQTSAAQAAAGIQNPGHAFAVNPDAKGQDKFRPAEQNRVVHPEEIAERGREAQRKMKKAGIPDVSDLVE